MKALLSILLFAVGMLCAADYTVAPAKDIRLDGKLDEGAWANAAVIRDFTLLQSSGNSTPSSQTEARLLADREALYIGVICEGTAEIQDDLRGRVANAWTNDLVEIFLAPTESLDEYYQFAVTAGGAWWNQYFAEGGNIHPDFYEPQFEVATGRMGDSWTLEMRFPFHVFYHTSAAQWHGEWAVNLARYQPGRAGRPTENSSWAVLNNSFHEIHAFHRVDGIPPKPWEYDLRIAEAHFDTMSVAADGIAGRLTVRIELEDAPEGRYLFHALETAQEVVLKRGINTVSLPATFAQDGRTPVRLTLCDAEGKTVAARHYPVLVEASPIAVRFDAPQYGGNFYPGEDATRLKGTIRVNLSVDSIVLTVAAQEYTLPVVNGLASFDIDVSGLAGDIPVAVGEYFQTTIRHVHDALAWIRGGRVVVAGAPSLLLGWYGSPEWIVSKPLRDKYPTIHGKHPITFDGWINAEISRLVDGDIEQEEMVFDRMPSQKVFDALDKAIAASRDSELFCYYLCDEPECRGISPVYLRHLYRHLKKRDPRRLVMVITREPLRYIECADLINPHPYISPSVTGSGKRTYGMPLERLRDICTEVEALHRPDKALLLTPQVFSYSSNDVFADYPTFDEINVGVWSSVCHGGQGITPFIWYDHFARPCTDLGCDFIYQSLFRLKEFLVSDDTRPLPGDEGRVFTHDGETLYLIDNVFSEKRTFELATDAPRLYRFREEALVVPDDGRVTIELEPYDVVLLSTRKLDAGLPTEAELRTAIAQADYDRSHRGNLLYGKGREIELSGVDCQPYPLQNAMEQQDKLFDGNLLVSAWMPRGAVGDRCWLEMAFTCDAPHFSKARIYGNGLEELTFRIWESGEWTVPAARRAVGEYSLELDFGKQLSTNKIRLDFPSRRDDVELYEFELLE